MRPSIRVSPAVITERVCGCCRIRSRPPCLIAPDTYTFIDDARSLSRPCPDALRPSGLDLCAPVFAPCLLGCPGTPRQHSVPALNPRVRGSSPWRRTRSDLGFYRSRSLFLILCGAALRPAWGREMFEMPAHPAVLCPSGAFFAYGHDDNRRSACARRCGSVRLAFSCVGQRRVCRVRPGVRFTSEGWSSQAGGAPTVRAADLPGAVQVHVTPAQPGRLAAPQAAQRDQVIGGIQPVPPDRVQELRGLPCGPHSDGGPLPGP